MAKNRIFDDANVPTQKKYFKWYPRLPLICACVILFLFFVWGIVDPLAIYSYRSGSRVYGVMHLSEGFLCWLIWFIIGSVIAVLEYLIAKVTQSQKILCTLYLQYLCEKGNALQTEAQQPVINEPAAELGGEAAATQKELETLKQLFEAGAISEQEYENKKKEILGV